MYFDYTGLPLSSLAHRSAMVQRCTPQLDELSRHLNEISGCIPIEFAFSLLCEDLKDPLFQIFCTRLGMVKPPKVCSRVLLRFLKKGIDNVESQICALEEKVKDGEDVHLDLLGTALDHLFTSLDAMKKDDPEKNPKNNLGIRIIDGFATGKKNGVKSCLAGLPLVGKLFATANAHIHGLKRAVKDLKQMHCDMNTIRNLPEFSGVSVRVLVNEISKVVTRDSPEFVEGLMENRNGRQFLKEDYTFLSAGAQIVYLDTDGSGDEGTVVGYNQTTREYRVELKKKNGIERLDLSLPSLCAPTDAVSVEGWHVIRKGTEVCAPSLCCDNNWRVCIGLIYKDSL